MPKEKYSFAPEVYDHWQPIARHYNLMRKRRAGCVPVETSRAGRPKVTTPRGGVVRGPRA